MTYKQFVLDVVVKAIGPWARYRVTGNTYLPQPGGPMFIRPFVFGPDGVISARTIRWDGIPNKVMVPINWPARIIHWAWKRTLGPVNPEMHQKTNPTRAYRAPLSHQTDPKAFYEKLRGHPE